MPFAPSKSTSTAMMQANLISAYSTPPKANNQLYSNKKTYATAFCSDTTQTTQPMTISPTIASPDLTTERSSRIEKLLAQLTEKNALHASVERALDPFTSLAAKLEKQQAMLINQQTTLNLPFIMKSVAAIKQQLAPASSSSRKQSCQTTHATMHHQIHQLTNHLPLHATPMICSDLSCITTTIRPPPPHHPHP
jgi:hypothetical protein